MPETVFYGKCSEKKLIDFSLKVIGIVFRGGIPKKMVAIPISKKRPNCHQVMGCDNGKPAALNFKEIVLYHSQRLGFYQANKVRRARWISKSRNEIIFSRINKGSKIFSFELKVGVFGSQYRKFLQEIGVGMTEVTTL